MTSGPVAVEDEVGPGETVLVLGPELETGESSICTDLLTPEPPSEEALLTVAVMESPAKRVHLWERYVGSSPAAATVIDVDTTCRSASSRPTAAANHSLADTLSIETVDSPSDLTGLGIEMVREIDDMTARADDPQPVVCFHSLTPLLQYVSREALFRFTHTLSERLAQADAVTHFHMDPTVHDEQTVATFRHLFDVVVEYDDGEWTLRTR